MDAVIFGAGGFCGKELLRAALANRYPFERVIALYRSAPEKLPDDKRLEVARGCLTNVDFSKFIRDRPYILFHFANSKDRLADNLQACRQIKSNVDPNCLGIFFASSLSVYGDGPHEMVAEDSPLNPQTALAKNRLECESLLRESRAPVICLRPRMIVGENDQYFLPKITKLFRRRISIGNENQKFSFIEVRDYSKIVMQLSNWLVDNQTNVKSEFNVGYKQPLSIKELRRILVPSKKVYGRIPIESSIFFLRWMPFGFAQRLSTKLSLIGRNQTLDSTRLEDLIGNEILARNPIDVISNLVSN